MTHQCLRRKRRRRKGGWCSVASPSPASEPLSADRASTRRYCNRREIPVEGEKLDARHLVILAAQGRTDIRVYLPPSTGSELCPPGAPLAGAAVIPLAHNFCESCNSVWVSCIGVLCMCLGKGRGGLACVATSGRVWRARVRQKALFFVIDRIRPTPSTLS